jgi:hypothetical protein
MVPNGLDGERQLLRTGFRQSTGRHPQERLVSGGLARERQLLHPLRVRELGSILAAASPALSVVAKPPTARRSRSYPMG